MANSDSRSLDVILKKLEDIESKIVQLQSTDSNTLEKWKTEEQTQALLQLGTTSLWRLRTRGEVEYTKIGNRTYYSYESILAFMDRNAQKPFEL